MRRRWFVNLLEKNQPQHDSPLAATVSLTLGDSSSDLSRKILKSFPIYTRNPFYLEWRNPLNTISWLSLLTIKIKNKRLMLDEVRSHCNWNKVSLVKLSLSFFVPAKFISVWNNETIPCPASYVRRISYSGFSPTAIHLFVDSWRLLSGFYKNIPGGPGVHTAEIWCKLTITQSNSFFFVDKVVDAEDYVPLFAARN